MNKIIKVGYENRNGVRSDLKSVPRITIANHILEKICDFYIGDKVSVEYSTNQVIIKKLT